MTSRGTARSEGLRADDHRYVTLQAFCLFPHPQYLRDRTSVSIKSCIGYKTIRAYAQVNLDVVTTQRIIISKRNIIRVKFATMGWIFVMLNDDFTIEIVHII